MAFSMGHRKSSGGQSRAMSVVLGWTMNHMAQPDSLRLILVGPLPPPYGGMANQTRQLAELLRKDGVDVELVAVNEPYRPRWVGRVPLVRAFFRLVPYVLRLWRVTRHGEVMHVMANSGWSWHFFAAPAILIARVRKVPVVVNYRGGEAETFMAKQSRWVLPVLRMAERVAVPSAFLRQVFSRYQVETSIIPNIVDLSRFNGEGTLRPPLSEGPHLIVTRNLEALYDNATAIRAFARIRQQWPNARLTIAGSGPELSALQSLVASLDLGESVSFAGRLERDEIAALYASAHIMLNPSRADNMPNSVLEAWASGVVVISTDVGGVPYLVEKDVDAVLVPIGEPDAMADAVLDLLRDSERYGGLRAEGLRAAERFGWDRVKPLWSDCYRQLSTLFADRLATRVIR